MEPAGGAELLKSTPNWVGASATNATVAESFPPTSVPCGVSAGSSTTSEKLPSAAVVNARVRTGVVPDAGRMPASIAGSLPTVPRTKFAFTVRPASPVPSSSTSCPSTATWAPAAAVCGLDWS